MQKVKNKISFKLIFLLFGCLLLRPAALGEKFNSIGIVFICCATFLKLKEKKTISIKNGSILISIVIYWIYICIQSLIMADTTATIDLVFNSAMSNILVAFCFSILFDSEKIGDTFLKKVIILFAVLAASYTVTFIIVMVMNNWDSLYLFQIRYAGGNYSGCGKIFFPFTISYNYYLVFGRTIRRFLSVFRECGILPAFYIFLFYRIPFLFEEKNKRILLQMALALGCFFSFSFAGYIAFAVSILFNLNFDKKNRKKTIALVLAVIIGLLLSSTISDMSFEGKLLSGSLTERTNTFQITYERLQNNLLFGSGFANNAGDWGTSVNYIGTIGKVGIVGLVLFLLPYIIVFKQVTDKKNYLACIVPVLIIIFFAQPIASQNLTNIFVFLFKKSVKRE